MGCSHCRDRIDKPTEHFEFHHHQAGSGAVLQHTFCCSDCLREYLAG